ncbi:MAG: hypothetical protein JSS91_03810 [Bacteroidetes bacterium]|nr:hypothetical protein [Bacteroidota bacterium]
MNFFYLAHSVMSFECLKGMVSNGMIPELVVIHKDLEREKLRSEFYEPITRFCRDKNIKLTETDNVNEISSGIEKFDTGICVGFMNILNKEIFSVPVNGIYNLHCGRLPEYRGRAPISRSIMNGEQFLTISMHKIDEGVDSGDVCIEREIKIENTDDVNSLYKKCSDLSSELITDLLYQLENHGLKFRKQIIAGPPNRKVGENERRINWNDSSLSVFNLIRAVTFPYPCAYSFYKGNKILFLGSEYPVMQDGHEYPAGVIKDISPEAVEIYCGKGSVRILKAADEGLNEINFPEKIKTGEKFE